MSESPRPPRAPDAPRLPVEVEKRLFDSIFQRAEDALAAHEERDGRLADQYDLLSRSFEPPGASSGVTGRWQGACNITDPLVLEQFMALFAAVRAATSQRPFWFIQARSPEDDTLAQRLHRWAENTAELDNLDAVLYDRDYITLRDGMAALHACWDDYGEWVVKEFLRDQEGMPFHGTPGVDGIPDFYPELVREFNPRRQGVKWTAIDRANIYTVPANCADPQEAESVMHRVWLSQHDLLHGVQAYNYDPEVVERLIKAGPTHTLEGTEFAEVQASVAGVDPGADGYYEVFVEYCYLPIVLGEDGGLEPKLEHLYDLRFQVIHCPIHSEVLRWRYWPHTRLPYVFSWMMRVPNTMDGESVPSVVGPFQEEATANVRLYYDAANLVLSPMFKVKETSLREFGYPEAYPGAVLPYRTDPKEIEPLFLNLGGLQIGLQTVEHPLSRARQALSGESTIKMDDRVRKATEVQASMQGMSLKFSLVLANIQASMKDVLELMLMFYRDHHQMDPEMLALVDYRVLPRANAQNTNPVVRLANIQAAMDLVRNSPLYQMAMQRGDFRLEYHMLLEALSAVNFEGVARLLGEEPAPPAPPNPEVLAEEAMAQQQLAGVPPEVLQAVMGQGPMNGAAPMG